MEAVAVATCIDVVLVLINRAKGNVHSNNYCHLLWRWPKLVANHPLVKLYAYGEGEMAKFSVMKIYQLNDQLAIMYLIQM